MLDIREIRTANTNMKSLYPFIGFLLLAVWVSAAHSDIPLTLKNKQYLSPPIQELPIKEDYYSTQESKQKQSIYGKNNYANSKYQIFKTHNHFEQSKENSQRKQKPIDTRKNFGNDNYASSRKGSNEQIFIEHINAPADFPLNNPILDNSFVNFAAGNDISNEELVIKHEIKNNIPVPLKSNTQHIFSQKNYFNKVQHSPSTSEQNQNHYKGQHYSPAQFQTSKYSGKPTTDFYETTQQFKQKSNFYNSFKKPEYSAHKPHSKKASNFKGPDYLPPRQYESSPSTKNSVFRGAYYLPPRQIFSYNSKENNIASKAEFKGPDYLPPQRHYGEHAKNSPHVSDQFGKKFVSESQLKGHNYLPPQTKSESADYLPPLESNSVPKQGKQLETIDPFESPGYLPSHEDDSVVQQNKKSRPNEQLEGPDYLPPLGQNNVQQQNKQFKGPDYLPPTGGNTAEQQNKQFRSSVPVKGPDYLPPIGENKDFTLTQPLEGHNYLPPPKGNTIQPQGKQLRPSVSYKGPDYLPPPKGNKILKQHVQFKPNVPFKGPDYLPPVRGRENIVQQQDEPFRPSVPFKGPDYLPSFEGNTEQKQDKQFKPSVPFQDTDSLPPLGGNAGQQQSEPFKPTVQFKGPDYLPPLKGSTALPNGQQLRPSKPFKGPDYLPPPEASTAQQQSSQLKPSEPFKGPDYLPPLEGSAVQQQSSQLKPSELFKGPDYLPPHEGSTNQQQSRQLGPSEPFKGPDYLPPLEGSTTKQQSSQLRPSEPFRGPDYLPPRERSTAQHQSGQLRPSEPFKGPDYLPPLEGSTTKQQNNQLRPSEPLKGPDYLPPVQGNTAPQQSKQLGLSEAFKGPDYLPPRKENIVQPKNEELSPSEIFKGPDYLPPLEGNTVQQRNNQFRQNEPFKGQDYLPPSKFESSNYLIPQQQVEQHRYHSNKSFDYLSPNQLKNNLAHKVPDFLPPVGNDIQEQQQPIQILPPGYDFQKPPNAERAIEELHKLPEESANIYTETAGREEHSNLDNRTSEKLDPILNGEALPPGYDFQKPENSEQAIKLLHSQERTSSIQSVTEPQNVRIWQQHLHSETDSNLPKKNKPQGAVDTGEATSQQNNYNTKQATKTKKSNQEIISSILQQIQVKLFEGNHKTQILQGTDQNSNIQSQYQVASQISQSIVQPFKGPDYLPPVTDSQASKEQRHLQPSTFKGPDYLPPTVKSQDLRDPRYLQAVSSPQTRNDDETDSGSQKHKEFENPPLDKQEPSHVFKGPDYLPPANIQSAYPAGPQTQFKGPDYLPPTVDGYKPVEMHPLSSLMTDVNPNDRYGNRRSFPEYGLPPAKTISFLTGNEVSPMYSEPTSRPQYYAPAVSYTNNHALSSQTAAYTKNQFQGTSTLSQQTRQALQVFMPEDIRKTTPTAAKAKIRTVQIVNPDAVKTLKVLESLDHTGAKTIKILGPTNEPSLADHSVVKVVSGSNNERVQTVKIYNDHQDITSNENSETEQGNGYLSPRRKRNPTTKIRTKRSQHI